MKMRPVESSNLDAVGWSDGMLTVRFRSGSVYSYAGVPRGVYQRLLHAESKGRFFSAHIRNQYMYTREDEGDTR
jgi:hypothetical protein